MKALYFTIALATQVRTAERQLSAAPLFGVGWKAFVRHLRL